MTDTDFSAHELLERNAPKDMRDAVLSRDNNQCQACGTSGDNKLHLHHLTYRSQGGKDTHDNLVTLCFRCHAALHMGIIDVTLIEVEPGRLAAFCTRRDKRNRV